MSRTILFTFLVTIIPSLLHTYGLHHQLSEQQVTDYRYVTASPIVV